MDLLVLASGAIRCIYDEKIPLSPLGRVSIQRGSNVEPDSDGLWLADLSRVNGPTLGPFPKRTEALEAEVDWLRKHWLTSGATTSAT